MAARDKTARERAGAGRLRLLRDDASGAARLFDLLSEYGIRATRACQVTTGEDVLAAATAIGYPVVLKTDEPAFLHKSDVGGVVTGIRGPAELSSAYRDLV